MAGQRTTHVRKWYEHQDGNRSRSAKPGWTALVFECVAPTKTEDGKFITVEEIRFPREEFPADILDCAAGHGLMQKYGDDLAGLADKADKDNAEFDAKRGYADYIRDRLSDMHADAKNGIWVEEGEGSSGGGNVTMLMEAILRTFAAAGVEVTAAQADALRGKLKETEYREKMRKRTDVARHLADIVAERAEERRMLAAKAAKAASEEFIASLLPL